jgi:hypothetical protein
MAEFETGGFVYRTTKMNAREQMHLLRAIAPLSGAIVAILVENSNLDPGAPEATRNIAMMIPLFQAFAKMDEKETDLLVNKCFAYAQRREGANGSSVWGPPLFSSMASRDQYNDIDLGSLFTICWNVVQDNLGGFFGIGAVSPISSIPTAQPQGLESQPGPA